MAEATKIQWATHSFNPWMGCAKVSAGCRSCYAETLVTGRMGLPVWGAHADRKITADSTWKEPYRWQKKARAAGERHRVFCASLADVFEPRPEVAEARRRLFQLIEGTPDLDWLLLTKRPESAARLARDAGWTGDWPENVWAGTTVESQEMFVERVPHLLGVPARVRFLSCEPLLESIDLTLVQVGAYGVNPLHDIGWVIVGGESGPGARPFDLEWARQIRHQCNAGGSTFFFKQAGSRPVDGGAPLKLRDSKGGDLAELPADLRVQQFPALGAG